MKLVFGIGINDKKGYSQTKQYRLWVDMLKRCGHKTYIAKQPSYHDCFASDNFKVFSYFYDWCGGQIGFNEGGFQLDKDLLVKRNREYSERNCIFLPGEINGVLEKCGRSRGHLPIGVCFCKTHKVYKALVRINGRQKSLGSFGDPISAFHAYKIGKEGYIKQLAEKHRHHIDPRAYDALMQYTVEITD